MLPFPRSRLWPNPPLPFLLARSVLLVTHMASFMWGFWVNVIKKKIPQGITYRIIGRNTTPMTCRHLRVLLNTPLNMKLFSGKFLCLPRQCHLCKSDLHVAIRGNHWAGRWAHCMLQPLLDDGRGPSSFGFSKLSQERLLLQMTLQIPNVLFPAFVVAFSQRLQWSQKTPQIQLPFTVSLKLFPSTTWRFFWHQVLLPLPLSKVRKPS